MIIGVVRWATAAVIIRGFVVAFYHRDREEKWQRAYSPGCTSLSSMPTLVSAGAGVGTFWLVGLPFPAVVVVPPIDSR